MSDMNHLFFDLDRTLWDFETNSKNALKILYDSLDLKESVKNFYDFLNTYKRINNDLWVEYGRRKITKSELRSKRFELTLQKFNVNDYNLADQLNNGYIDISPDQTAIFPHAIETLDYLKKSGYNIHVITNGFKEVQHRKINNCGFDKYVDLILCSEDVGFSKPDPRVFHYAMDSVNAKPNKSVMIGDDLHVDYYGALHAGMRAILFDPEKVRRKKEGDFHVNSLHQIPEILPWVLKI